MKINLSRLKTVEKTYDDTLICLSTLNDMVNIVLNHDPTAMPLSQKYIMAYETLKELGVIADKNNVQQLNS